MDKQIALCYTHAIIWESLIMKGVTMAQIVLIYVPPIIKGGSSSYYVSLEGQGNFGIPFQDATIALQQLATYKAQGHTLSKDPLWKQEEVLKLFNERAARGQ